ncbi:tryptophan-tRNA ligase [Babesia caballi]|uniref:Tryptophan-tRNA ligase n=1 Tax=Babesia caballi TaxID=5871 RepID=A0AAV4LU66_BABCB|nr:tryptophan-tRNA ligase [Babesia caballi]
MLRLTGDYGKRGCGKFLWEYKRIFYPEGAFTPDDARQMYEETRLLKIKGGYYDPVKLAMATGQFQLFKPSTTLKNELGMRTFVPILYHNVFGGWFEIEAAIFIMPPEERYTWPLIKSEIPSNHVPQEIRDSLLIASTINNYTDLWRDYPKSVAELHRYDLLSYTKVKSRLGYAEWDHPFVRATQTAKAFGTMAYNAEREILRHKRDISCAISVAQKKMTHLQNMRRAAERGEYQKHVEPNKRISGKSMNMSGASAQVSVTSDKNKEKQSPTAGATDEVDASPEGMSSPADASLSSKKLTTIREEEEAADGDLDEVTENPDCTTRSTAQ